MSWQATAWAVAQQPGSPAAKLVLIVLAVGADECGVHRITTEDIAAIAEMSVNQVCRHLLGLRNRSLVEWDGPEFRLVLPAALLPASNVVTLPTRCEKHVQPEQVSVGGRGNKR